MRISLILKQPIFLVLIALVILVSYMGAILFFKQISFSSELSKLQQAEEACQNIQTSEKPSCWEDLIDLTLNQQGLEESFNVFTNLYKTEPQFASACHGYAHRLGEATYQLLIKGQEFQFPPETALCGYGFYHGLTELLLQTKGPREAGMLCDSKKSQITQVLYGACYHGIGHGALSSSAKDSQIWGNPQKMINFALELCNESINDSIQRARCASGVFMELGEAYTSRRISLDSVKDDPYKICRGQESAYQLDCYSQMYVVLSQISNGDLSKAAKFVEDIPEDQYAVDAIRDLVGAMVDINNIDQGNYIPICRDLQDRLHFPCIQGIILAFMLKGQPGVEYQEAIKFCKSDALFEEEKQPCFELLLKHSSEMYPAEKISVVCSEIAPKYKKNYCLSN